jgi:hypothetical protein
MVEMHEEYEDLGDFELPTPTDSQSNGDKTNSNIRILQVTDLHCFPKDCDSWSGIPLLDSHAQAMQLVDQLVQDTKPDFIMITGDVMDGRGPWSGPHAVVDIMLDLIPSFHGIPWAFIPGNHDDDESPWTRKDLMQLLSLEGCIQKNARGFHHTFTLSKKQVATTTGQGLNNNHCNKVRLYLFDSGWNHPNPKIYYYPTPPNAVQSFRGFMAAKQADTDDDDVVVGLVYIHIPTPEFQGLDPVTGSSNLFDAALQGGKIPPHLARLAWLIRLLKFHRIAGCTRGKDSGLFPAIVEANKNSNAKIVAIFCGHDHHSDAVFYHRRSGIFLGYGRSGSFTPPMNWEGKAPNPLLPGARVVEVSKSDGGVATTWVQTKHGVERDSLLDMVRTYVRFRTNGVFSPPS